VGRVLNEVDLVTRTSDPASAGRVHSYRPITSYDERIEDLRVGGVGLLVVENNGEVRRICGNACPRNDVRTAGSPTATVRRGCDAVSQRRRGEREEKGGRGEHRSWCILEVLATVLRRRRLCINEG